VQAKHHGDTPHRNKAKGRSKKRNVEEKKTPPVDLGCRRKKKKQKEDQAKTKLGARRCWQNTKKRCAKGKIGRRAGKERKKAASNVATLRVTTEQRRQGTKITSPLFQPDGKKDQRLILRKSREAYTKKLLHHARGKPLREKQNQASAAKEKLSNGLS